MILLLLACTPGGPEAGPARVQPTRIAEVTTWVRDVATDGTDLYWTAYDNSSGRSARALIQKASVLGGPTTDIAVEQHPPEHLAVHDGVVYWSWKHGSLKRLAPGDTDPLVISTDAADCFDVDDAGVVFVRGVQIVQVDARGNETVLVEKALTDCPVLAGDRIVWAERMAIRWAPRAGGTPQDLAALKKVEALHFDGGSLFGCYDDKVTAIDPESGEYRWVRDYCSGDALVVTPAAHYFVASYYDGWPPMRRQRVVEVTNQGPSWLFDGDGTSPMIRVGDHLGWVGTERDSHRWTAYAAPLPEEP